MTTEDELTSFGKHVKSLRAARGLSQEELAERSSLSADTIRRMEHDEFSPSLRTIKQLLRGLEIEASTLFLGLEFDDRDETRELVDLVATRSPADIALVTEVVRTLLRELDAQRRGQP